MRGKKILVVEDELLISRHIEQMVISLGYQSAGIAESGEQALALTRTQHPDLVLMDIRLKGQMDGTEAAATIWKEFSIPIVFLTAYADDDTLANSTAAEPFGYLIKPFEEKELLVTIELAFFKHHMEIKNREQRRWLNAILSSITEGLVSTDQEGRINFLNPAAARLLAKKEEEIIGLKVEEVISLQEGETGHPFHLKTEMLTALYTPETNYYLNRAGALLPVELQSSPVRDENGHITGYVLVFRDITLRKSQEEQLHYLAIHDSLTGLPNRILFNDRLKICLEQARRKKLKAGIIMLDLDLFKKINDSYGHTFGDRVLMETGKRLTGVIRKTDTVARFGGDEFAVILGELKSIDCARQISERIITVFNQPLQIDGRNLIITASLGLAFFPDQAEEPDELLKKADLALYAAKEAGRNGYKFFGA
ncbi:MAG: diguanylate cyclase [Candidatus Aminicenantes bacterium]|nr:diguanylate cyclase [Candidatus Aminicenantes bacterium]